MDDLNNQSIGWLDVPAARAAPAVVETVVNSANNASRLPARIIVGVVERFSVPARHRVEVERRREHRPTLACVVVVVNRVNMFRVRACVRTCVCQFVKIFWN
jgi:hypothetical protein